MVTNDIICEVPIDVSSLSSNVIQITSQMFSTVRANASAKGRSGLSVSLPSSEELSNLNSYDPPRIAINRAEGRRAVHGFNVAELFRANRGADGPHVCTSLHVINSMHLHLN